MSCGDVVREWGQRANGGILLKRALLLLFASVCVLNAWAADKAERRATPDQARVLVLASLTPKERQLPKLETEPYNGPQSSRFVYFAVTWSDTPNGSFVVGSYAVDPYTGDVFSATSRCHEEKTKNLEALQKQFRTSMSLSQAEYLKLKTKGPLCGQ